MIHLDVTSACRSALNTGVKRMQRGLHAWLSEHESYQPVYWQASLRDYRTLRPEDIGNLENPNGQIQGLALYDSFSTGLLADWANRRRDRSQRLAWPQNLQAGDLLLVPDFLWDNRAPFFRRPCAANICRMGIFHDAIPLRVPHQASIDAYLCSRGIRALARFDKVICVSHEAEADLQFFWKKLGEKPVPTHVVSWPIPFEQKRPDSPSNFESKKILCLARLQSYKNHLVLLDACDVLWREGVDFKLRLIGCRSWPITVWKVLRRIEALQAAGRDVVWQAHVTEEALHAAYRSSSFTVFPSLMEGFGLPIIESLWHGRPVVCGANGALGEAAADGGCETADMKDTTSLATAIRRLLTDRASYEQLCTDARNRKFRTWEQYCTDVLAIAQHR